MAHGRGKLWTVGAKRYSTEQNSQVETQKKQNENKIHTIKSTQNFRGWWGDGKFFRFLFSLAVDLEIQGQAPAGPEFLPRPDQQELG